MTHKLALALALVLSSGAAFAQSGPPAAATNPNYGDPVITTGDQAVSAEKLARTDQQPMGTENGNQPDRTAAMAGGAR